MCVVRYLSSFLLMCIWLPAQQTPAPEAGVTAVWDVRANMKQLADAVRKLEPILKQLKPDDWIAKGSSGSYIQQVRSSLNSMQSLFEATDKLALQPEQLSTALEAYFRMERMDLLLSSLNDGIRRYQSPELSNELNRLLSQTSVHRDRLRQHIQDLAGTREQEFKLMDREAQRCRETLSQQPIEHPKPESRRNRRLE